MIRWGIGSGSSTSHADGANIARVGDEFHCPIHGDNKIISSPVVHCIVDSKAIVVVGSKTECGATISSGSPSSNSF